VLRKSAASGLTALAHEVRALERQLADYRRNGEFDGDCDEDGVVLWDRADLLSHEIAFAYGALMELRKAFAIAAYHHWERSVQLWIEIDAPDKKNAREYKDISKAASKIGYPADVELPRVNALANMLKHNSKNSGTRLLQLWPDILLPQAQNFTNPTHRVSDVQLGDEHLNEIFDIVSRSGPNENWGNFVAVADIKG